eukprot:6548734-Pyramimonas_sp.AAC.1
MKRFKDSAFKRLNAMLKMVAATQEAKEDATTQRNGISVIKFQLLSMRPSYKQKKILDHGMEKVEVQIRKNVQERNNAGTG